MVTTTSRKIGRFRIDSRDVDTRPQAVVEVFSLLQILPLKAEYRPDWDAYEYMAIGPRFQEVPRGFAAEEYKIAAVQSSAGDIRLAELITTRIPEISRIEVDRRLENEKGGHERRRGGPGNVDL